MEPLKSIKQVLMERDKISSEEADDIINDLKERVREIAEDGCYSQLEDFMMEEVGLEPDYLDEIMLDI